MAQLSPIIVEFRKFIDESGVNDRNNVFHSICTIINNVLAQGELKGREREDTITLSRELGLHGIMFTVNDNDAYDKWWNRLNNFAYIQCFSDAINNAIN